MIWEYMENWALEREDKSRSKSMPASLRVRFSLPLVIRNMA